MDIRSFFQPKKAAAAPAAAAATSVENNGNSDNKNESSKEETPRKRKSPERLTVSADEFFSKSASNKNESSASSSLTKKAKREIIIESSDDDDDEVVVTTSASAAAVAKKKTIISTASPPVKAPPTLKNEQEQEMSPRRSTRKPTPVKSDEAPVEDKRKKAKASPAKSSTKTKLRILEQPIVRRATPPSLQHTQCLIRDNVPCTFCFSGVLENVSRESAQDMVKSLGGRVTTAVSSKTDYLVVGNVLEDGRDYQQGSKYKRAMELGSVVVVQGEELFYGLLQTYHDLCGPVVVAVVAESVVAPPLVPSNPYSTTATATTATTTTTKTNPYAKKASNPYASATKTNPYGRKTTSSVVAAVTSTTTATISKATTTHVDTSSMLWVDKYKPKCAQEILGNQDAVKKLTQWLNSWERTFNTAQNSNKAFSAPNGPWKAALLSGPPGIGSKYPSPSILLCNSGFVRILTFACASLVFVRMQKQRRPL